MQILDKNALEISAFAGVLERIYVMDKREFRQHRKPESWQGFEPMMYLAHAHFKPRGSTGLHSHHHIDIVTVVTQGSFIHKGSLGDETSISDGQVLVQRSGEKGFRHNEINAKDSISSIVQIWMKPEGEVKYVADYEIIDIKAEITQVYQGAASQLNILHLKGNESYYINKPFLGFLYQGSVRNDDNTIETGSLFTANSANCLADRSGAKIIILS